jgi:hypothetical protein
MQVGEREEEVKGRRKKGTAVMKEKRVNAIHTHGGVFGGWIEILSCRQQSGESRRGSGGAEVGKQRCRRPIYQRLRRTDLL